MHKTNFFIYVKLFFTPIATCLRKKNKTTNRCENCRNMVNYLKQKTQLNGIGEGGINNEKVIVPIKQHNVQQDI